jgi:hypothetical protein
VGALVEAEGGGVGELSGNAPRAEASAVGHGALCANVADVNVSVAAATKIGRRIDY